MSLTKLVSNVFSRSVVAPTKDNVFSCAVVSMLHTSQTNNSSRQGGFYKMDYVVKRERPIGPHKKLAPGVRYDGRVGPIENYRYRVIYPKVRHLLIGLLFC